MSHKPGGRLPLLPDKPAVTLATLRRLLPISLLNESGTMDVSSLPKTVTRQRGGCDLNPGLLRLSPAGTLATRLPSHPLGPVHGE